MSLAVSGHNALAAATDTVPTQTLYSQLEQFHGHVCAGSIFGARLGFAASAALKKAGGTGKFTARYYDLSCPVDGIQVAAGTTYGNAALAVEDRDEHRLVLTALGNKVQVEARLTKKAEELGLKSRSLVKKAKGLPAAAPERKLLEQEVEEIYTWLRTAPHDEVVLVTRQSVVK
jgi:formylmethanofuran dehydrogenase subunit E